mmetsp:Transcript_279/g.520  ORF Transcript_279/g.520 Transcript_279/m.520 type:complete len:370 (+) Transcript_279:83-1192(+)|eukprot:CAMPEP_0117757986 /NCGR_PEP_ID=MMETSP0947-20121206/15089_1 /TAXON_ID=44440 /ORGANISM="Chattonella subsalsa, Strain CCMP2191" /LENGTH=369 /DNA_ID=CAMNT_0005578047 /DNA_START=61 /DNA_END=1173 /DNA_ORIENTATION=+
MGIIGWSGLLVVTLTFLFSQRLCGKKPRRLFEPPNSDRSCCYVGPAAIGTWGFSEMAVEKAKEILDKGGSAMDAVEAGINVVELDTKEQYYVGYGGLPNAEGKMEMDAAVMEGKERLFGAVMACPGIRTPISLARKVMESCQHNVLVGDGALKFAISQGMEEEEALSDEAKTEYLEWKKEQGEGVFTGAPPEKLDDCHDTVGLICLDKEGNLAAGCSTSGWKFKLPGRVGDSPLIGSGLYCDNEAGAAVATGTGEEIMRCCLSFLVVEYMRMGLSPTEACQKGIERLKQIVDRRPNFGNQSMHQQLTVAVIALNNHGQFGAATTVGLSNAHRGRTGFPAMVWTKEPTKQSFEKGKVNLYQVSYDDQTPL